MENIYLVNNITKPTNSPTQGEPNPREIRLKATFWAAFFPLQITFRGLGLILCRKQNTRNPTQPKLFANNLNFLSGVRESISARRRGPSRGPSPRFPPSRPRRRARRLGAQRRSAGRERGRGSRIAVRVSTALHDTRVEGRRGGEWCASCHASP